METTKVVKSGPQKFTNPKHIAIWLNRKGYERLLVFGDNDFAVKATYTQFKTLAEGIRRGRIEATLFVGENDLTLRVH